MHRHLCLSQVGGQCPCKTNVDSSVGRLCDTCKFNTANLGSDSSNGCQACGCDRDGIVNCTDDLDDGTCVCKPNVNTTTGDCSMCETNFYNKSSDIGCLPCDCDVDGTTSGYHGDCHKETGQCTCSTNVQGKHSFIRAIYENVNIKMINIS